MPESEEEDVHIDYRMFVAKSGWQWLKQRTFQEVLLILHLTVTCAGLYLASIVLLHIEDQHTSQVDRVSASFDKALDRLAGVRREGVDPRDSDSKVAGKSP